MTEKGTLANAINDYDNRHETSADKVMDKEISIIEAKCEHSSSTYEVEDSEPILFNKNGEMDFAKSTNDEILDFIQRRVRMKNELEKELDQVEGTYADDVDMAKGRLMELEEVKTLGTGKERETKVKSLLQAEMQDSIYLKEMSVLKNTLYDIKNELDLAREIYRLKNI